ncbi:hypothetical protein [Schumannella soli]|uniref:Uncharacterized protein n=1 Tax=Schumannella soli TaxID=2590779 RepID=A0A506XZR4_9MICO|nr:hypothetical protein [Schumannella soli]TPW74890.1 hypothetical protein FJ657_15090 [Schumannella soli]
MSDSDEQATGADTRDGAAASSTADAPDSPGVQDAGADRPDSASPELAVPDSSEPDATRQSADRDADEVTGSGDGLLSRLRVIEDQPLESRAAALTQIHDELRTRLEASDTPRGH